MWQEAFVMGDNIATEYENAKSALHNHIFLRMFQIGDTLECRATKEHGITSAQRLILRVLSRSKVADGMLFSELAEHLLVNHRSLNGLVKCLERHDHVKLDANRSDRCATPVLLPAMGSKFWNSVQNGIYKYYQRALKVLNSTIRSLTPTSLPNWARV